MKRLLVALGATAVLLVGSAIGGYIAASGDATGSRNSSGSMAAINGPYTPGTVISSSVINARLADIETELTDSKSRSGKGDFSAPVRGADGSVAAPTWSFTSETGTGYYRIGSSDLGLSISGTKTGEWTANGLRVANGAVATPSLSFFNDTGSGLYRIGSNDLGFAVNGVLSTEWNSSGFGIGGPATALLTVTKSGSATSDAATMYQSSLSNGNLVALRIGKASTGASDSVALYYSPNATAANSTGCLAVSGQNNTLCVDGNNKVLVNGAGVNGDASGFKHKRVSGCTTAATAGATCSVTVTWGTTFADANYTAVCGIDGSSGPAAMVGISSKIAASMSVAITAVTANAATATTFDCIAVHD